MISKNILRALSVLPLLLASPVGAQQWKPLFDGRTLQGWHLFNGADPSQYWSVKDGVLSLASASGRMSDADLVTDAVYRNFELELEWKIGRGGNSGVFFRAARLPETRHIYETGPEMQILDDAGHADGKTPSHRAGSLYDLTVPPANAARPVGEWNRARLRVADGRIQQWLNGHTTADVPFGDDIWRKLVMQSKFAKMPLFGTLPEGHIALQDHGEPVSFRNIRIRVLKD